MELSFRKQLMTVLIMTSVIIMVNPAQGYRIVVDALADDCFYDHMDAGAKFSLIYEVIDGGFLDIDFRVINPEGKELFSRVGDSGARVALSAGTTGKYTYCFSNRMSTVTPKEIKFNVEIGGVEKPITTDFGDYSSKEVEEIQPEKLEIMIRELRSAIHGIRHEQEFMEVRDRIHMRISESTNLKSTLWFAFEAILVFVLSVSQVWYIKRFFEVRRIV